MKKNILSFSAVKFAESVIVFTFCLIFGKITDITCILPLSVLISALLLGASIFLSCISYLVSFLVLGNLSCLLFAGTSALISIVFFLIFKARKITPKFEIIPLLIAILALYVFLPLADGPFISEGKIYGAIFALILTCITIISSSAVINKTFKRKIGAEEVVCIFVTFSLTGLGISNLVSPFLFKAITILAILISAYLFKDGKVYLFSVIAGISLAVYYKNVTYVSVFLFISAISVMLTGINRYTAPIGVLVCDFLSDIFFGVYGGYVLIDFLSALIPCVIFLIIPTKILAKIKDKIDFYKEKQLLRETVNRQRILSSNKLFELSNVFNEMASAFKISENYSRNYIKNEVREKICKECSNKEKCLLSGEPSTKELDKLLDIGFAKGRVSLIDLPKNLASCCVHPNNVLYAVNKLLSLHRQALIEKNNVKNGRELLSMQSLGVSEVLKSLALETGSSLKYLNKEEKKISDTLLKLGVAVDEILVYGEENNVSVGMVIKSKEYPEELIEKNVSLALGFKTYIEEKYSISDKKVYLKLIKALPYDAIFGVTSSPKQGSIKSGDTHSVIRISRSKLLIALSDGMGSGSDANELSSVSLSLIESFYKAGLNGDLVLGTVNKLLSINTEDSFTALDVAVLDLKNLTADFIKYGSPYGFIIGEAGIRIVSGGTLPLGIIDEIKPAVARAELNENEILLFLSDGVLDTFGSSDEIIAFLRTLPYYNPQNLTDALIERVKELSHEELKDDVTALAVRVYKKTA